MIQTQSDAKRIFLEKVLTAAQMGGVSLTEAERRVLSWSESDPDFKERARRTDCLDRAGPIANCVNPEDLTPLREARVSR